MNLGEKKSKILKKLVNGSMFLEKKLRCVHSSNGLSIHLGPFHWEIERGWKMNKKCGVAGTRTQGPWWVGRWNAQVTSQADGKMLIRQGKNTMYSY
jgi:hypothetical protein